MTRERKSQSTLGTSKNCTEEVFPVYNCPVSVLHQVLNSLYLGYSGLPVIKAGNAPGDLPGLDPVHS